MWLHFSNQRLAGKEGQLREEWRWSCWRREREDGKRESKDTEGRREGGGMDGERETTGLQNIVAELQDKFSEDASTPCAHAHPRQKS